MNRMTVVCVCAAMAAWGAWAQKNPTFQASFTPEGAMYERGQRIDGVTLSIWGENPQTAFSLGFVNGSTGDSSGISLGLINYTENYVGIQVGIVDVAETDFNGWQGGFGLNYAGGHLTGLQTGCVNLAGKLSGLQIGLVNYAQYGDDALQIGLANVIADNVGWFDNWPDEVSPGMVLVNWHF